MPPNQSKPRAILFEPIKVDIANAADFGTLTHLFDIEAGKTRRALLDTEELTRQTLQALHAIGYNPDVDVIVTTGHVLGVSILVAVCASYYGVFKCAVYNNRTKTYLPRNLGQPATMP